MAASTAEMHTNWKPLERLFSAQECASFMYMGSSGGIERYKHRETRRYLNIDAETGEFYLPSNGGYIEGPEGSGSGLCLLVAAIKYFATYRA